MAAECRRRAPALVSPFAQRSVDEKPIGHLGIEPGDSARGVNCPVRRMKYVKTVSIGLVSGMMLACGATPAAQPPVFATERGAIDGVDPVAYFVEHRAIPGKPDIGFDWNGAHWLFSNAENRARFEEDPEAFAPRFGGYCAYGVASGYAVKSDPNAWTVSQGRLYLNYDAETMTEWRSDQASSIATANEKWPGVLGSVE